MRASPFVLVLLCACQSAPAREEAGPSEAKAAAPTERAEATDPTHSQSKEALDAPEAAEAAGAQVEEPSTPTAESLAARGITLPTALGGSSVENMVPLTEVSPKRVGKQAWVAEDTNSPFESLLDALQSDDSDDFEAVVLVTHGGGSFGVLRFAHHRWNSPTQTPSL